MSDAALRILLEAFVLQSAVLEFSGEAVADDVRANALRVAKMRLDNLEAEDAEKIVEQLEAIADQFKGAQRDYVLSLPAALGLEGRR